MYILNAFTDIAINGKISFYDKKIEECKSEKYSLSDEIDHIKIRIKSKEDGFQFISKNASAYGLYSNKDEYIYFYDNNIEPLNITMMSLRRKLRNCEENLSNYISEKKLLEISLTYSPFERMKSHYDNLLTRFRNAETCEEYENLIVLFKEMKGFENSDETIEKCKSLLLKKQYDQLIQEKYEANSEKKFQSLAKQFQDMLGYENSEELANECSDQYRILKEQRENKERIEGEQRERRRAQEKKEQEERERKELLEKQDALEKSKLIAQQHEKKNKIIISILILGLGIGFFLVYRSNKEESLTNISAIAPYSLDHTSNNVDNQDDLTVIDDEDYIFPFSSNQTLTEEDLEGLSKDRLRLARNEIYARYGRQFQDESLQLYFNAKEWYKNTTKLPMGEEPILTDLELKNIEMIKTFEAR